MVKPQKIDARARAWRAGLLIACGVSVVGWFFNTFECSPLMPWCSTTMGFEAALSPVAPAAMVVTGVDKTGPGHTAGLRSGDILPFSPITFKERMRLRDVFKGYGGVAGERLRYVVLRGNKSFTTEMRAIAVPATWGSWDSYATTAAFFWVILFSAILAIKRPDSTEARLLALILLSFYVGNTAPELYAPWPAFEYVVAMIGSIAFLCGPIVLLAALSSLFARPLSTPRKILTALSYAAGGVYAVETFVLVTFGYVFALPVFWLFYERVSVVGALWLSMACAIAAIVASRGPARPRILWITISLLPIWLYWGLLGPLASLILGEARAASSPLLNVAFILIFCLPPPGITYAILARRSVDLGYVVNRTAIFSAISLIVLVVFVLLDYTLGGVANGIGRSASVAINLTVALVLGLSLALVHRRVERAVDWLMFRKRNEDVAALRRFGREAVFVTRLDTLCDRTIAVVMERAGAGNVTMSIPDLAGYCVIRGAERAKVIDANDPAILALKSGQSPVHLHRYETALHGELAFPMSPHGHLIGIMACGVKQSCEAYAPDEIAALQAVSAGVGAALENFGAGKLDRSEDLLDLQAQILEMQSLLLSELRTLPGKVAEATRGLGIMRDG